MSDLAALQAALAAEDAAIYGYGVAGALLTGTDRDYATGVLQAHQVVRDRLMALVSALGPTPVAAQPAYQLPSRVTNPATARELAASLEQGVAGAFWDLVAASAPASQTRSLAIGWLSDTAIRAAHWGPAQPLPGQPA
jgi:hypothetical protein